MFSTYHSYRVLKVKGYTLSLATTRSFYPDTLKAGYLSMKSLFYHEKHSDERRME